MSNLQGLVNIARHERAKADISDIFTYPLERNANAAQNFLEDLRYAFDGLAGMPLIGAKWESPDANLIGVRFTTVSRRFKKYLIFYQPNENGILVVAVIHGARDLVPLLRGIRIDPD